MITVYQFGPQWDVIDASPFCAKLIAWLRLVNHPFETRQGVKYLRRAPKGKLPFVKLSDGSRLADSSLIIAHLKAVHGDPLAEGLTAEQRAITHAVGRMLDESLYWCIVHYRWIDQGNFERYTAPAFFDPMPPLVRQVARRVARAGVRKSLHAQGTGRHGEDEIAALGERDLQSLVDLLGTGPYLLGDRPLEIDAHAYAFLSSISGVPHASPLKDFIEAGPLADYVARLDGPLRTEVPNRGG